MTKASDGGIQIVGVPSKGHDAPGTSSSTAAVIDMLIKDTPTHTPSSPDACRRLEGTLLCQGEPDREFASGEQRYPQACRSPSLAPSLPLRRRRERRLGRRGHRYVSAPSLSRSPLEATLLNTGGATSLSSTMRKHETRDGDKHIYGFRTGRRFSWFPSFTKKRGFGRRRSEGYISNRGETYHGGATPKRTRTVLAQSIKTACATAPAASASAWDPLAGLQLSALEASS